MYLVYFDIYLFVLKVNLLSFLQNQKNEKLIENPRIVFNLI